MAGMVSILQPPNYLILSSGLLPNPFGNQTKGLPIDAPLKTNNFPFRTISGQLTSFWLSSTTYFINISLEKPSRGWKQPPGPPCQRGGWGQDDPFQWGEAGHPSSAELSEGSVWIGSGPQRLWWVTPPHWGVPTTPYYHTNSQLFISIWSSSRFSLISLFLSLQVLRTLREAAEVKRYTTCLEWEGLQEVELALAGTPASWLVDLVAAGIHRVDKSAPPPSGPLLLVWRDDRLPLLWSRP